MSGRSKPSSASGPHRTRISGQLFALLNPAQERETLAEFLTVEMRETLGRDAAQQAALLAFIRNGLSKGATLKDAMKTMAQSTRTEAGQIKARLPASQQQLCDRVCGADGLCLFQFMQVAAPPG